MTAERGNTKHGPQQDEQLEHEARGMVQGHGGRPHVEPFRESEPLPDDTDPVEVERAFRGDAREAGAARDGSAGDTADTDDRGEEQGGRA